MARKSGRPRLDHGWLARIGLAADALSGVDGVTSDGVEHVGVDGGFPAWPACQRTPGRVGPAWTRIELLEPDALPSGCSHTASASESVSAANTPSGEALMTQTAVSVRLIAGPPVALIAHARAERPGLDQVQRDVFGDRRQERCAATDDDRIAEHAQLVDGPSSTSCRSRRAPRRPPRPPTPRRAGRCPERCRACG